MGTSNSRDIQRGEVRIHLPPNGVFKLIEIQHNGFFLNWLTIEVEGEIIEIGEKSSIRPMLSFEKGINVKLVAINSDKALSAMEFQLINN